MSEPSFTTEREVVHVPRCNSRCNGNLHYLDGDEPVWTETIEYGFREPDTGYVRHPEQVRRMRETNEQHVALGRGPTYDEKRLDALVPVKRTVRSTRAIYGAWEVDEQRSWDGS